MVRNSANASGVFILFDHALGTNLKATCIVFLYYSDGALIKFPIAFLVYHKGTGTLCLGNAVNGVTA